MMGRGKKRERPSKLLHPDPVGEVFALHRDVLLKHVVPYLSLVDRNNLSCVNKPTRVFFRASDVSLDMMASLWLNKYVQVQEKVTIIIKRGNLECTQHMWYKRSSRDHPLCREGIFMSAAAAGGNKNILVFLLSKVDPRLQRTASTSIIKTLCISGHEAVAADMFVNKNKEWPSINWDIPIFVIDLWTMACHRKMFAFEKVLRAYIIERTGHTATMTFLALCAMMDIETYDYLWFDTPKVARKEVYATVFSFVASMPTASPEQLAVRDHVLSRLNEDIAE